MIESTTMRIAIPAYKNQTIIFSDVVKNETHVELIVGKHARVTCVDTRRFIADLVDFSVIIEAQQNSSLHYCDQRIFSQTVQVTNEITITAAQDSRVQFEQWQQGGRIIHTNIDAYLIEKNSEINLRLCAHLHGNQEHIIQTRQHHQATHTQSRCSMKTIVSENAHSRYEGIIQVDMQATHSEAFQNHKALVMNDGAYAYARPSLQVHTDEVQCGHGSAIGQLDEEQLLYLQARGVPEADARRMLEKAFFAWD